ncbi:MAG: prephenate dehydratase [Acutalibacteraceae bacterium]|nr:prephenate dehydratase [Acutalibacteraceae bacterium]
MNLDELRAEIDKIDDQLIKLFQDRMEVASKIGQYKKDNGLPVLNSQREREILNEVADKSKPEMKSYLRVLYSLLFELSRSYQEKIFKKHSELYDNISQSISNTNNLFPTDSVVACQGVEGSYSQIACEKIFKNPNIMYFNEWEKVFSAIEQGFCDYGILPIENSTAGSVKQVYDLMVNHNFSIVRSTRIQVNHCLLAKKGTKLSNIKEVISHEQALTQCSEFLSGLDGVKITTVENTAIAAQMVAESDRDDIAALSSNNCAELYNLNCLKTSVQDKNNNYTRFICISKNLEIYPGADKTSLMLVLQHKPGALYKVLSRLYALDINLIKLESRPLSDRDFEFMFYFDLETSIYSEEFVQLICELDGICDEFKYLGSYSEVI